MFIPYRAKIKITRIPTVTIIVAVVCLLVFWAQQRSWERIEKTAKAHCTAETAETPAPPPRAEFQRRFSCPNILLHIYFSSDTEKHLAWHVKHFEDKGDPEAAATLTRLYRDFASKALLVHRRTSRGDRRAAGPARRASASATAGSRRRSRARPARR